MPCRGMQKRSQNFGTICNNEDMPKGVGSGSANTDTSRRHWRSQFSMDPSQDLVLGELQSSGTESSYTGHFDNDIHYILHILLFLGLGILGSSRYLARISWSSPLRTWRKFRMHEDQKGSPCWQNAAENMKQLRVW